MSEREEIQRRLALLSSKNEIAFAKAARLRQACHDRLCKVGVELKAYEAETRELAAAIDEVRDTDREIGTLTSALQNTEAA